MFKEVVSAPEAVAVLTVVATEVHMVAIVVVTAATTAVVVAAAGVLL